jgi:DNA-binding NtrC family response regulator
VSAPGLTKILAKLSAKPISVNEAGKFVRPILHPCGSRVGKQPMYTEGNEILIVDSDAARRELCERVLSEEGFAVTAVAEGFSAIRAAGRRRFAVAIAAVRLPGTLDGPTTLREIRARRPGLRALLVDAGAHRPELPDDCCEEFIAAPFKGRELLGCVFELLQRPDPVRRGRDRACYPAPALRAAAGAGTTRGTAGTGA